jgi:ribosomal protein S27AE
MKSMRCRISNFHNEEVGKLKRKVAELEVIKTPSPAADCAVEQAEGNGPCGACAGCCHDLRAEVERLRAACESALHDLRSHDGDDEGGYIDSTEQDLRKALGLCPKCTDGMEQSGRARITCGTCGGTGLSKEGG